mgnify:CR=1 FL=1
MPLVRFSSHLIPATRGAREATAAGATLRAVLDDLERQMPGFRFRVVDEQDAIRPHVNFFVNKDRVEAIDGVRLKEADVLSIFGSLSGG